MTVAADRAGYDITEEARVTGGGIRQPLLVRAAAQILSFLFHPVLIPVYVSFFMVFVHPSLFAGYTFLAKRNLMGTVVVNLCFLPAFTVFLCWRLKFTSSMFLKTQKERIIPLAAAMIFYFWCWYVLHDFVAIPVLFRQFMLGCFATIIAAWMANIYYKISLHALAAGGMACFMLLMSVSADGFSALYISVAILIAGAVGSARLIVSDHRPFEVYSGLAIGALCQLIALWLN
ncbi:MAG: hypothetical protein ABI687_11805 [Flavitalea sp.]